MKKFGKYLFVLTVILVLTACSANNKKDDTEVDVEENQSPPAGENVGEEHPENLESQDLSLFFLPDGSKAHYKGEGNEFAELDIETNKIGDDFVVIDEDNGGVLLRKIFKIEEDQIVILSNEPIDLDEELPNEAELTELQGEEVYLKLPLEVGENFGKWLVTEIDESVETPYKTFENAIVIEKDEDDYIERRYFVEEYGEVVRESIMEMEDDFDYIVISSLESVN